MTQVTLGSVLSATAVLAATLAIAHPAIAGPAGAGRDRATEDLSNAKQLATAVAIYTADADDRLPPAYAPTPRGGYRPDARFTTGASDYLEQRYNWAAAIFPYCRSEKLYAAVGAPRVAVEGEPDPKLPGVGHAYNGLLHEFMETEIAAPTGTVLFSESYGFVNLEGWAVSNPVMTCVEGRPCRYVPAAKNCGGTEAGTTSRLLAHPSPQYVPQDLAEGIKGAKVQVMSFVDTSARRIRFDDAPSAPYPADTFLWSRLDADGKALSYWSDRHGCHPLRFRPDYEPERDRDAREIAR